MTPEMERLAETVRPRVWTWRANPQRPQSIIVGTLWSYKYTYATPSGCECRNRRIFFLTCEGLKTKGLLTFNTHTSVESTLKVCGSEIIPLRLATCSAVRTEEKASSTCLSLLKHAEKTRSAALWEAWIPSMHQVSAVQSISLSNAAPVAASIGSHAS